MGVNLQTATLPFNVHAVVRRIRKEVTLFADAAMFDIAAQRYGAAFHQLVACIVSVRMRDEVSLPTAIKLFEAAPDAGSMSRLSVDEIAALIRSSSFYGTKAHDLSDLARRVTSTASGQGTSIASS